MSQRIEGAQRRPGTTGEPGAMPTRSRLYVWDVPVRVFHWLLVGLITVNIYTGNVGGVREMELHMLTGYGILALVLFRIAWGLLGSHHARFHQFVRGPRAVMAYGRSLIGGTYQTTLGHNPIGGWSVVALLCSLLLQAATGLFSNDDILTEGPLAKHVTNATSNLLTEVHELNATILYILIAVHVLAVFGYLLIKRENLIRPMVTGWKEAAVTTAAPATPAAAPAQPGVARAALILAVVAVLVWAVVTW